MSKTQPSGYWGAMKGINNSKSYIGLGNYDFKEIEEELKNVTGKVERGFYNSLMMKQLKS